MPYRIEGVLESVQEGAPAPRASRPNVPAAAPTPSPAPVVKNCTQPKGLGFTAGGGRVGAWRIGPAGTATFGYQEIPVYRDGKTIEANGIAYPYPGARITLYRPGAYDIAWFGMSDLPRESFGPPADVTVAGRLGVERAYTYTMIDLDDLRAKRQLNPRIPPNDPSIRTETFTRTAVAWQYGGEAWAVFMLGTGREPISREQTLAIAAALEPVAAEPVRAPYDLGWLPAGWKVTAAEQDLTDRDSRVVVDYRVPAGRDLAGELENYPGGGRLTIWRGGPNPATRRRPARP